MKRIQGYFLLVTISILTMLSILTSCSKPQSVKTNHYDSSVLSIGITTAHTTASSLNVRAGVSTSAKNIGVLTKNSTINILGSSHGFYKISYKGKTGYISSSYVTMGDVPAAVQNVPVLMYHKLSSINGKLDGLVTPVANFRLQMRYLKINGYHTITLDQFNANITNKTPLPSRPVLITFDDGYISNYTLAYPIIKANGQKATVFAISSFINKRSDTMTSKELKIMDVNGFRVENHTYAHVSLATQSYANQLAAIKNSKTALEKMLGRKINYLAYPCGSYNSKTPYADKAAGATLGFTTNPGVASRLSNRYAINRIFVGPLDTLTTFAHKLSYGR